MMSFRERSLAVFPAGSLGEYDLPAELCTVLRRGRGPNVWDADGRQYLDFTMGWGSVLLGHAHPDVVSAIQRQVERGTNYAYVNEPALELAEEVSRGVRCAERVRFCASGTEATAYAARLARGFTARNKLLKFEGAYHGANDLGTASLFPKKLHPFPLAEPTSAGVPQGVLADILVAPFNDLETTVRIVRAHSDDLAAIVVEPLHRCTPPRPGFLAGLRELATSVGALLVFDEVVTGFRLAYGGAQERYGVVPDLAALGKALGGGQALGAVVGRADLLDLTREDRLGEDKYVWFASSVGGNPVACASALATLQLLRNQGVYPKLDALGDQLRTGLRQVIEELGVEATVQGEGPLAALTFSANEVVDYRSTVRADGKKKRAFLLGLFRRGIFLNPMSTKLYVSLAHTDDDLRQFLDAARQALEEL